ncbi:hypothetical protein OFO01_07220 [Campylobacter sp. JMF_01 NE2]|uniref:hypothetical protein n=1 Tax=unclassified Campylobacter TaxID=2593542 RepID=UPI0022E9F3D0|nr:MULTISPECIES: hypothetical protein [unclassified Campylobacter]MDA3053246.1 hypothetical protein [Campylobacter sp. JMF_03 NE3]MDA3067571.1 hypothetical protein [Campylobacter sp. JMF_01 NE2]
MGYRPNIVAEPRDYGEEISGFNYNSDKFETLLEELFEVEYFTPDNQESLYEIENSEVEKLKTFEFDNEKVAEIAKDWGKNESYVMELATSLKNSLIGALDTNYSKKIGYVAIEWF